MTGENCDGDYLRKRKRREENGGKKTIGAGLDYVNAFREYENMFKQYDYETSKNVAPIAFTLEKAPSSFTTCSILSFNATSVPYSFVFI